MSANTPDTSSNSPNAVGSKKKKSGESHRIYWQQWISSSATASANNGPGTTATSDGRKGETSAVPYERSTRRELITSSAAVRLSRSARASDVTNLLRQTLQLGKLGATSPSKDGASTEEIEEQGRPEYDSLVLVGTLYSLPRDYVKFDNLLIPTLQNEPSKTTIDKTVAPPTAAGTTGNTSASSPSDPFHVIRTLKASEKPLEVRDDMNKYLNTLLQKAQEQQLKLQQQQSRTIISPKLQWYFVPNANSLNEKSSQTASQGTANSFIPNCIELDGYCTSLENDNDTDSEDTDESNEAVSDAQAAYLMHPENNGPFLNDIQKKMVERFPWLQEKEDEGKNDEGEKYQINDETKRDNDICKHKLQKLVDKEDRNFQKLLKSYEASGSHNCFSGYLFKRDRKDHHVWRRMHCILTNDHLWYVSRVYSHIIPEKSKRSEEVKATYSKYRRVRLTRALLLEPSVDYPPLFRTPYAFEVVSGSGVSHVFRACNKKSQMKWIKTLSERIVQSYENNLLSNAELIVADECLARSRRITGTSAEPLWSYIEAGRKGSDAVESELSASVYGSIIGAVLRWGLQVAEYRECCRHIQANLPAKSPVVAVTPRRSATPDSKHSATTKSVSSREELASQSGTTPEQIDRVTRDAIRAAWDLASTVLARATHVAHTFQQQQSSLNQLIGTSRTHSHVETLCRHIDYVITGRFKPLSNSGGIASMSSTTSNTSTANGTEHQDIPPPTELFDPLLVELQRLAVTAEIAANDNSGNAMNHIPTDEAKVEG